MTRSLHKARIHPTLIQRLSKLMVKENLDEQLMESLDYATISNALKSAGVSSWGTRRQIFQCFSSGKLARKKNVIRQASTIFGGVCGNTKEEICGASRPQLRGVIAQVITAGYFVGE